MGLGGGDGGERIGRVGRRRRLEQRRQRQEERIARGEVALLGEGGKRRLAKVVGNLRGPAGGLVGRRRAARDESARRRVAPHLRKRRLLHGRRELLCSQHLLLRRRRHRQCVLCKGDGIAALGDALADEIVAVLARGLVLVDCDCKQRLQPEPPLTLRRRRSENALRDLRVVELVVLDGRRGRRRASGEPAGDARHCWSSVCQLEAACVNSSVTACARLSRSSTARQKACAAGLCFTETHLGWTLRPLPST